MNPRWLVINSGVGAPDFNMALDEALLLAMPRLNSPALRLYGWTEAAATFGYFQRYDEVENATLLRPLIRRPTGGGLVPHDADWTYSFVFPTGHEWYALKAIESYRAAHTWVAAALAHMNVSTELAIASHKTLPGQCFSGHERFDVLWNGRKIAGAAQRRTRDGLLIQGSIQPPPLGLQRSVWESAMTGADTGSRGWEPWTPDRELLDRAGSLAAQKYSQVAYNRKR
jgi:lipoate-protein ligase A